MISRRQYFSIVLIFFAVFLLFQGTQAGKSLLNPYDTNAHMEDAALRSEDTFGQNGTTQAQRTTPRPYLLYIGSEGTARARVVREWASYAKMGIRFADEVPSSLPEEVPTLLVADSADLADCADRVEALLEQGTSVLCAGLPDTELVQSNDGLRALLGIRRVWMDQVDLHGVHLFSGFFLGGERIYDVEKPEEEPLQDMHLSYPWFWTDTGTKVYLQGVLDDAQARAAEDAGIRNEQLPALIWRVSRGDAAVFVCPGAFMDDVCVGMGMLSAAMGQTSDFYIYPVVNAHVESVLDFPVASNENAAAMLQAYGRSQTDLSENVILPMLITLSAKKDLRLTCCTALQLDYSDDELPIDGIPELFLGRFNETGAEMALSLLRRSDTSLREKLDADDAYLMQQDLNYRFSAACADPEELEQLRGELSLPPLDELRTVLSVYREDYPVIGFFDTDVTLQQILQWENTHTYMQDLRLLGIETALGYSNAAFDMAQAMWPEAQNDQWQSISEGIFANMTTYIKPFAAFDNLTASESDTRVRRFLTLDYETTRQGRHVKLSVNGFNQEAHFVLRTFNEEIDHIEGGSWTQIEENAYLIRAERADVTITLAQSNISNYR